MSTEGPGAAIMVFLRRSGHPISTFHDAVGTHLTSGKRTHSDAQHRSGTRHSPYNISARSGDAIRNAAVP